MFSYARVTTVTVSGGWRDEQSIGIFPRGSLTLRIDLFRHSSGHSGFTLAHVEDDFCRRNRTANGWLEENHVCRSIETDKNLAFGRIGLPVLKSVFGMSEKRCLDEREVRPALVESMVASLVNGENKRIIDVAITDQRVSFTAVPAACYFAPRFSGMVGKFDCAERWASRVGQARLHPVRSEGASTHETEWQLSGDDARA